MNWEVSLIEWLQKNLGGVGISLAKLFSELGGTAFLLAVLLVLIFCYRKEVGKRCGIIIIASGMWFPMIKNVVMRLRPYMEHESIQVLMPVEKDAALNDVLQQGYSFPSGHAAMNMAIYGSASREVRKKWMWISSLTLVFLIGISRFIVGVHYPTDVLAGWAIGLLAISFGVFLEKKVEKEWIRNLILLAVTVPGIFWCKSRDYFTGLGVLLAMIIVFPYEKKHINFQDTRNGWAMVLRVAGAICIYLVLNKVLKMPFSEDYLNSGMMVPNLIRSARYAIILFVILGVYPRVFPIFEKAGKRKG